MRNLIPWRSRDLHVVPSVPFAGLDRDSTGCCSASSGDAWGTRPDRLLRGLDDAYRRLRDRGRVRGERRSPGVDPKDLEISVQATS